MTTLASRLLDAWERRSGRRARLVGFSTHYNVSIDPPSRGGSPSLDAAGDLQSDTEIVVRLQVIWFEPHCLPKLGDGLFMSAEVQ